MNGIPKSTSMFAENRNQRILIIDDNTSIHEDIRKILGVQAKEDEALDSEAADLFGIHVESLSEVEFEIDSAFQGQEGLAMVQRSLDEGRPYAMALVDVRMPPGWDGIETISRIWKMNPDLQVVICTAYSDYSWEEMIRKVGKTDNLVILKKPFDNVEVLQLAHTLTQKWTLSHRLQCHLEGLDQIVASRTEELQTVNARLREEMKEREQTEKELHLSEERFSKAFQASPIPMTIQSLATEKYLDVNSAFLTMSGLERHEVISRTLVELNLCFEPGTYLQLFQQLREHRSVRNFEYQHRTSTGEARECQVSAEVIELDSETVALVATLDVSEHRRLEKQLRHAQKLEAVGQLASGVAHDFNNILTIILGHASLQLAAANIEKDMADSLNHVTAAAERAATLTRQLLAFSRKQIVQPQVLNLNRVLGNLRDMLSRLIGEHIELRCEFPGNLPAIYADEGNIDQIVMNLVVNARDAMPEGGLLIVRMEAVEIGAAHLKRNAEARPGPHICLSVTDAGCGMNAETLGHIFEPFFTTKEVGKGTGLGLATVHGIVAQHDGWVEVISKEGEGSTFKVFLPVSDKGNEELANEIVSVELQGGDETILVVEDEQGVRDIIAHTLKQHGYRVLEAADGPEAMNVWSEKSQEIDLLVTDIVMPNGISGDVLAGLLKADKVTLKVIFSSGYSMDFATVTAPLSDQINFLQKPYKLEILIKAVRDCLDS